MMTWQLDDRLYGQVNSGLLVDEQGNLVYAYRLSAKPKPYEGKEFVKVANSVYESWKADSFWSRVDGAEVKKFSPDQPRDSHGRFSFAEEGSGGGGDSAPKSYTADANIQKWKDKGFIFDSTAKVPREKTDYVWNPDGTYTEVVSTEMVLPEYSEPYPHVGLGITYDKEGYRGEAFMDRLEQLNQEANDKALYIVSWNIWQDAYKEAKDAGFTDTIAKRMADGAEFGAKAYQSAFNYNLQMDVAVQLNKEFPNDPWLSKYIPQALETRETVKEVVGKAFVTTAIEKDDFLKVIEDGRFKTQFETRDSNGHYEPSMRQRREYGMFETPMDTPKGERPIYGFLTTQISGTTENTMPYNATMFNANSDSIGQYGDVRVVLNSDVRERTTWTAEDSLDGLNFPQPLIGGNSDKAIDLAGFWQNVSPSHDGFIREQYFEAQVHGGIKMSDVAQVVVTKEETLQEVQDAMLKAGYANIPVIYSQAGS